MKQRMMSQPRSLGKGRKQMARKGLHTTVDKDDSEGSDEDSEHDDSVTGLYRRMILTELYGIVMKEWDDGPEVA
ncbi:hypothetical protein Tco_0739430 [Tanacetum coccineum]